MWLPCFLAGNPKRRNAYDDHRLHRSRQHGRPDGREPRQGGHQVVGFDLEPASCEQAKAEGARIAGSARDAVAEAEVVVTMLPAGKHVLSVWADILPAAKPGALVIDCSTIDVESARKAHAMAPGPRGLLCRSTRRSRAASAAPEAATLTFMAGGSGGGLREAEPILEKMGKRVVHCGEAGAGQAAKICNNMILGISMIGVSEAFVLAEKLGLSHQALFDVASTSSGQCWSLTTYCPVPGPVPTSPANNGYKPGFAAALMLKDLKLAQEAALASGAVDAARRRGRPALRPLRQRRARRRRLLRHHQLLRGPGSGEPPRR